MAINGGTIVAILEMDTSKYGSAMQAAVAQAGIFNDINATTTQKMQGLAASMKTVGTTATLGLTLPIIGLGTASVKSAMDMESAFAGVRKTVDASEAEFANLKQSLVDLSEEIPTTFVDLSKITEMAGQLGVENADLLKFTRTIADLGVATNLTGEEAATMLAQYANVTGMPLDNIDRLGSVIVALGNNAATTERDIAEMAQRLSGAAQIMELTDAQTMGLAATMAELGINAEAGGSSMSKTMQTMLQAVLGGGKDLDAFGKIAGTTGKSFASTFRGDPMAALNLFVQGLARIKDAGGDVYKALDAVELQDMRITDTLLRMSGAQEGLTKNIDLANGAWATNNALTDEATKRYATAESQLQLAQNSISNMMASLGELVLPTVIEVTEFIGDAAEAINELDDGTKGFIVTTLAIVAALGPLALLIGGIISLLTGPAGIVIGVMVAGAAVVGLISTIGQLNQQKIDDDLEKRFGEIALSASDVEAILAAGFTPPTINYDKVLAAEEGIKTSVDNINAKVAELDKTIYLYFMTNDSQALLSLPGQITAIVGEARSLLAQQNNTIQLAITGLVGADDPDGEKLKNEFAEYFDVLDADATAKGNELRKAVDNAIADGVIDSEEEKTIINLRKELQEIIARGMMLDTQVEMENIRIDASNASLSPDSIKALEERIAAAKENAVKETNELYEIDKDATIKLGLVDNKGQAWIDAQVKYLTSERDKSLGNIDAQFAALGANSYGNQVLAKYAADIATFQTGYKKITDDAIAEAQQYAAEGVAKTGMSLNTPDGEELFNHYFSTYYAHLMENSRAAINEIMPDGAAREGAKQRLDAMKPTIESTKKVVEVLEGLGDQLTEEEKQYLADRKIFLQGVDELQKFASGTDYSSVIPDSTDVAAQALANAKAQEDAAKIKAEADAQAAKAAAQASPEGRAQAVISDLQAYSDALNQGLENIKASAMGEARANLLGVDMDTEEGQNRLKEAAKAIITEYASSIDGLVPQSVRDQANEALQTLLPDIQAAREQAAKMGDNVTPELQALLDMYAQIEQLAAGGGDLVTQLQNSIDSSASNSGGSAATQMGTALTTGIDAQKPAVTASGSNVGQGYVNGVLSKLPDSRAAGIKLARATDEGIRAEAQIASPSKTAEITGSNHSDGYVNGVLNGLGGAKDAGADLADATQSGLNSRPLTVADWKKLLKDPKFDKEDVASWDPKLSEDEQKAFNEAQEQIAKEAAARAAARRRAQEAAELAALKAHGQEMLAIDRQTYQARLSQMEQQHSVMMAMIGGDAAWYADTTLDKSLEESAAYYKAQQDAIKAQYDADMAKAKKQAQKDALTESYNERIALLTEQSQKEQEALRENYEIQKSIALEWINSQKELLNKQLAEKQEAARKEDYDQELADLQKKQRQSKSARERRELQEQIDDMIRDESLRQEEKAAQETQAAWDKLAEAISAGIIGLGDITNNTDLPDVAFGSGGLDALAGIGITPAMLDTMLSNLAASTQAGNTASAFSIDSIAIDLRGAVVRDESDIQAIKEAAVEAVEEALRGRLRD